MKLQLEHGEIKINLELEGIASDKLQQISKNIFDTFLDSIHIVNNESQTIIVSEELENNSAESQRIAQEPAKQETIAQESPDKLPDDPEDDQSAMAAALAEYEKAQAAKLAAANVFGLGRLAEKTPPAMLEGLHPTTYRQQGGRIYFQAFVICTDCRDKQKHFIERGIPFVNCRSCGKRNTIRPAATGNFPHVDTFGNIFIGGTFKRAEEREQNFQAIQA